MRGRPQLQGALRLGAPAFRDGVLLAQARALAQAGAGGSRTKGRGRPPMSFLVWQPPRAGKE